MVWSTKLESAVMTVECGGGHRSWDFCLNDSGDATFAAIKKKDVIFRQENLHHILSRSVLKVRNFVTIWISCQNLSPLILIFFYLNTI